MRRRSSQPSTIPMPKGARRFSSVVRIDSVVPSEFDQHRYGTPSSAPETTTQAQALGAAIQFGKDIVDGKTKAPCLPH